MSTKLIPDAVRAVTHREVGEHLIEPRPFDRNNEPPPLSGERQLGTLGNWWKRKNRGRSQDLDSSISRPIDLVEVIGDDQLAQQMTLTCQVRRRDQFTAATIANIPAVVGFLSWGNDGYQSDAEVDVVQGAQISVAGSFVRFSAAIDNDAPNNGGGEDFPPVVVGAHLSYQPTAAPNVQRTRYFALAANPASVELVIPPFARDVLAVFNGTALQLELLDRSGAVMGTTSAVAGIELPLPNDARTVRVTNLDLNAQAGRLIFRLWL